MNCSLTKPYALIAAAIAMLCGAAALGYFFLNWISLLVAVGLVSTVSFVMIPEIHSSINDYVACRGPSQRCSIAPVINNLGIAAELISIVSWTVAAALEIPAIAALASFFFAWIGVALEAVAAGLRLTGIASALAASGILVGVLSNLVAYKACRDSEGDGGPPLN
jgi:hypothetical protein